MQSFCQAMDFPVMPKVIFIQAVVFRVIEHVADCARVEILARFDFESGIVQCRCNCLKGRSGRIE